MDSMKQSSAIPTSKSKLARTLAKVLHIRVAAGIAPVDGIKKVNLRLKAEEDQPKSDHHQPLSFEESEVDELIRKREALEALLAKIFASISSVKANYAYLQFSQSPYDANGIQSADQLIVTELKNLSVFKQCFLKKQFESSPETTLVLAEIQEQKSLLKTYEITMKKMELQLKKKDFEATSLKEKLSQLNLENTSMGKSLNQSGPLSVLDNLHITGLGPAHLVTVLHHTMKSVRSFVRLMIDEMKSADWDIDGAASSIEPGVLFTRADHKCFAFESYVCGEMFEAFQFPNFSLHNESLPEKSRWKQLFFERFLELKLMKPKEYLTARPRSAFAKFCRVKYLKLIHSKMESAFFGSLNQRNLVNSGNFPDTTFFAMFAEVAKRVWLLHCLAFSFEPEAAIFQVNRGCRYSEVYMETVAEEPFENVPNYDPRVAFTVVPGFRIGKTVIQCQVYLVNPKSSR